MICSSRCPTTRGGTFMSAKLDQTLTDLTYISSALAEGSPEDRKDAKARRLAQKRADKQRAKEAGGDAGSRNKGKVQRTQDKLYLGQEPVRSKSGRTLPIGEPHQAPADRPSAPTLSPPAIRLRTTRPTPLAAPQTRPSAAVPTVAPAAAPAAPSAPQRDEAPRPAPMQPRAPQGRPGRRTVTEPSGVSPPSRESFLQRVKRVVTSRRGESDRKSLPQRAMAKLKSLAGVVKRRFLGEDSLPRTALLLPLIEQRSSTTFKKCPKGAMISSPGMRHSLPMNQFVNPDKDNPTRPIRSNCRASLGGVARSLQKDMGNAGEGTTKQTLQRINSLGGTRGKTRFRAWGTGVGGKRMETYRGKPGTPNRTGSLAKRLGISRKKAAGLHGVSTGKPDMAKHTSPYSPVGGAKGPAGNREVTRATGAHAKLSKLKSKGSQKRRHAGHRTTIARGKALTGR